jgi:hypothetical protein
MTSGPHCGDPPKRQSQPEAVPVNNRLRQGSLPARADRHGLLRVRCLTTGAISANNSSSGTRAIGRRGSRFADRFVRRDRIASHLGTLRDTGPHIPVVD